MYLYYNYDKGCFSLNNEDNSKLVFETHEREGWNNRDVIEEGRFKLVISTNFYPKSPENEYLMANIYVDGIQLLPVSISARITKSSIGLGLHGISFNQYGPGKNRGKNPCTYFSRELDWNKLLCNICKVSEQPEEWQKKEFQSLLTILNQQKGFEGSPVLLGKLIDLFSPYEKMLVSFLYPLIRSNAIIAMHDLLERIEAEGESSMVSSNMLKYGDLIWKCIKYNSQPYNQSI